MWGVKMRIVPCDQCNDAMIQGVYCHELGCPNKDKPIQYKTAEWYQEQVSGPGKFEGEPGYVLYFYELSLEGSGDYDESDNVVFDIESEDVELFPELDEYSMLILIESDNGFVSHELI